ncbi:hypothetical protein KGR20_16030 [Cytobacillus oceanisediminis]|uniref:Uncharacterized protein n=2 Tax=Niallia TaxID=2837506 RepID=A0A941GI34_NIACI|nr:MULTISPECIES: hypothetical protein [Bacillaceae]EOR23739.1 hypothetical protein A499_11209 [Niallia nealsonii AAU1]MDU1846731.1 hypothetical protein [Niallia nealsonii]MBZ9535712.1 hypothetical protein [Cytobacillus oceanisediminis]MCB5238471.1 hypothetical protein [Niallia circulans]MED3791623.1 hypothetical protein [Niallia alba]
MSKSEEDYLKEQSMRESHPFFEAPDQKILAIDLFRGPYTGFLSDFDLNNPGNKLLTSEAKWEEDLKRGKF